MFQVSKHLSLNRLNGGIPKKRVFSKGCGTMKTRSTLFFEWSKTEGQREAIHETHLHDTTAPFGGILGGRESDVGVDD